jgi:hypothetical protein
MARQHDPVEMFWPVLQIHHAMRGVAVIRAYTASAATISWIDSRTGLPEGDVAPPRPQRVQVLHCRQFRLSLCWRRQIP